MGIQGAINGRWDRGTIQCTCRSHLGDAEGDEEPKFRDAYRSALDCLLQVVASFTLLA